MRNIKKKVNMRYAHFMTWNMAKNIQNMENKIAHCRTWSIARNTEKREK